MQQRAVVGTSTVHEYDTVANAVRHLWAVDGLYGFYRGIAAHIVRSTPAASITSVSVRRFGLLSLAALSTPRGL